MKEFSLLAADTRYENVPLLIMLGTVIVGALIILVWTAVRKRHRIRFDMEVQERGHVRLPDARGMTWNADTKQWIDQGDIAVLPNTFPFWGRVGYGTWRTTCGVREGYFTLMGDFSVHADWDSGTPTEGGGFCVLAVHVGGRMPPMSIFPQSLSQAGRQTRDALNVESVRFNDMFDVSAPDDILGVQVVNPNVIHATLEAVDQLGAPISVSFADGWLIASVIPDGDAFRYDDIYKFSDIAMNMLIAVWDAVPSSVKRVYAMPEVGATPLPTPDEQLVLLRRDWFPQLEQLGSGGGATDAGLAEQFVRQLLSFWR